MLCLSSLIVVILTPNHLWSAYNNFYLGKEYLILLKDEDKSDSSGLVGTKDKNRYWKDYHPIIRDL